MESAITTPQLPDESLAGQRQAPPPPPGFVPLSQAQQPPPGFIPVQQAMEQGDISKTKAADLPMIGAYEGLNKFFFDIPGFASKGNMGEISKSFVTSFLTSVSNDEETAKVLENKFPGSKIIKDADGGTIFISPEGKEFAIDRPGTDPQDLVRGVTEVLGFAMAPGKSVLGAAAQAGTKQAAIEVAQEAAGAEFDPGTIAGAAAGGAIGEGASILLGRGIGSIKEGAEEVIKKGEALGSPVLTSDIVDPLATSAITRFITRVSDKYPLTGTAGKRAEQRKVRSQIGEDLAREFDITGDLEKAPEAVAEALKTIHKDNIARASKMRNDVFKGAEGKGRVPIDGAVSSIDSQIEELIRLGMKSDQPVVAVLQDAKDTLPKADNFKDLAFIRTRLIRAAKEAERGSNPAFPKESASRIKKVKNALDKDMDKFATGISDRLGRKWDKSNKLFADEYSAYDKTILAKIASEGDMAADKLIKTLGGTNTKDLKQLYRQMDRPARINARAAIMQDILDKSDYFVGEFSPRKLANALNKPNVGVFFKGDQRNQLDGLVRYIKATKGAQQAVDITPTGVGLAEIASAPVSLLGRAYQSETIRNLLVKLSKTNPSSKTGQNLVAQIRANFVKFEDELKGVSAAGTPEITERTLE